MWTFIIVYFLIIVFVFFAVLHAIKHAKEVDPKEPFLRGDYDPSKDPSKNNNIVAHECEKRYKI